MLARCHVGLRASAMRARATIRRRKDRRGARMRDVTDLGSRNEARRFAGGVRIRRVLSVAAIALAVGVSASNLGSPVRGDDPKPEKKSIELVYRWDLLAGKTAVYDAELTSIVSVERRSTTDMEESGTGESEVALGDRLEATTRTKQRLSMAFSKDERGRGRVRVSTERIEASMTRLFLGTTESISYDSANPPREGVPDKLKATVNAVMGKPYTLIVNRRGEVEGVDGRPAAELPSFKGTFLILPDKPQAEGASWQQELRQPAIAQAATATNRHTELYGDFVTKIAYKLVRATEGADSASSRLHIEATILTELDDGKGTLPREVAARVEGSKGDGHVDIDGRGLKLEEKTSSQYSFVVKQVSVVQTNRFENRSHWKLVEVK